MLGGLRLELTKERLTLLAAGGVFLAGLGIYSIIYQPLLRQLKIQGSTAKTMENELAEARSLINTAKTQGGEERLIKEEEVSRAIDELTREGKLKGINFISMTPRPTEKSADFRFQILPLEIETESTYEALGLFLGSLDDLKGSLMTVASFNAASQRQEPSKLRAKLNLRLYLSS